jgi:outer membrane protein OmpA-like peptidoglycan-associated protein
VNKNDNYRLPALLIIAALVGACSSLSPSTSLLDQARSDYTAAQIDSNTSSYAPLEMKLAGEAMEKANTADRQNQGREEVDKLAYLAKQKIALAREMVKQKSAEAHIASVSQERDHILLDQRTKEADQARMNAERSRVAVMIAEIDTVVAQRQTLEAQAYAAELEVQMLELAALKSERGLIITLGDVLFGSDKALLTANGIQTTQKLAKVLDRYPRLNVLIEGFTDSTGSPDHNQALSEQRASAVRTALHDMGIARERIAILGYGEAFPVAANDTSQNRQMNRRVEIVISDQNGSIPQR